MSCKVRETIGRGGGGDRPNTSLVSFEVSVLFLRSGVTQLAGTLKEIQEPATNVQRVHSANPSSKRQAMPTEAVRWWAWGESNSRPTV